MVLVTVSISFSFHSKILYLCHTKYLLHFTLRHRTLKSFNVWNKSINKRLWWILCYSAHKMYKNRFDFWKIFCDFWRIPWTTNTLVSEQCLYVVHVVRHACLLVNSLTSQKVHVQFIILWIMIKISYQFSSFVRYFVYYSPYYIK